MFGYLRQSTASQSRMVGPFVDDTDFKTPETALTINNTDVKLSKNGAVGVDKSSGGGTHRNNGMYSLTFDAADTDTVGELEGSILVAGALVVPFKFQVMEEAVYDKLFASGASLNDLSAAQVNTEVVDAINVDTYAEPGQGAPAATASLITKINYLYKAWRNKSTQTASTYSLFDDAGTTVDQKASVSDDGTTFTKGEQGTGP